MCVCLCVCVCVCVCVCACVNSKYHALLIFTVVLVRVWQSQHDAAEAESGTQPDWRFWHHGPGPGIEVYDHPPSSTAALHV
jgi:hypothetical protein